MSTANVFQASFITSVGPQKIDWDHEIQDCANSLPLRVNCMPKAQELARKISESKPDLATLISIKEKASNSIGSYPEVYIIILEALLSICRSLNTPESAEQTKALEEDHKKTEKLVEITKKGITAINVFSLLYGCYLGALVGLTGIVSAPTAMAVGFSAASLIRNPAILRPANLIGAAVGTTLYAAGSATGPVAAAAGLGTSVLTRLPVVQNVALGALNVALKASIFGLDCAGSAINSVNNALDWVSGLKPSLKMQTITAN